MAVLSIAFSIFGWVQVAVYLAIGLAGVAGAVTALTTREDAFDAADRQSRWTWVGLLALSALCVIMQLPFLVWIGMVVIGVYWFDVHPQIKSLLSGTNSW